MPRVYGNSPGKLSDSRGLPARESDVYTRPRGRAESVVNCALRSRGVPDFGLLSDMRDLFLGRRSGSGTVEWPEALRAVYNCRERRNELTEKVPNSKATTIETPISQCAASRVQARKAEFIQQTHQTGKRAPKGR